MIVNALIYKYFAERAKKAKAESQKEQQSAQEQYHEALRDSQLAEIELERTKREAEASSKNVSISTHWPILAITLIAGLVVLLIVLKLSKNA